MGTRKDEVTEFDRNLGISISRVRTNKKNETQATAAAAVGVNLQTYQHWEAGTRKIKAEHLLALAKHFEVSVDYLLGNAPARSTNPDVQIAMEYTGLSEEVIDKLHTISSDINRKQQTDYVNDFFNEFDLNDFAATLEKLYNFHFAAHLQRMAEQAVEIDGINNNRELSELEKNKKISDILKKVIDYYRSDKTLNEMLSFLLSKYDADANSLFAAIPVNPADIFFNNLQHLFDFALSEFAEKAHSAYPPLKDLNYLGLDFTLSNAQRNFIVSYQLNPKFRQVEPNG